MVTYPWITDEGDAHNDPIDDDGEDLDEVVVTLVVGLRGDAICGGRLTCNDDVCNVIMD